MKTIELQLEEAGAEVRRQVARLAPREPQDLHRRVHHRRVGGAAVTVLVAFAAAGLSLVLATGEPEPSGSASQPSPTEALVDQVTFEQYEAAYSRYVQCLREAGYQVEGPLQFGRDPNAGLVLFVGVDPTLYLGRNVRVHSVDEGSLDAADAACWRAHVGDIEERWLTQRSATFISERAWIDNLLACAEASGIEIPESLSYEEMLNEVGIDPSDDMIMDIAVEAIMDYGCRPWEANG